MNVSVFGLGYVGSVSAASFAADGHTVVGVDVNPDKVASLNEGRSPIVEKGLDELIRDDRRQRHGCARRRARRRPSTRPTCRCICVGTPSRKNGSLDLSYLERVCEQIGEALKDKTAYHVVVVRSTVLPGTTHDVVIPALERTSGKKYGDRLRRHGQPGVPARGHGDPRFPQSAADARRPQLPVGRRSRPRRSTRRSRRRWSTTNIRTAEMMKYASNTWHALKVCFANEIGNLCKRAARSTATR